MVYATISQLHRASDADNNAFPSRSYFQKTVCLQDWWLTSPWTDDGRKALGVSGVTSTSQDSHSFPPHKLLKLNGAYRLPMVSATTSQLHRASDADNNAFPSRSYFQKTVCLQDWWLTSPWTDDGRKALGVSGVTSTSQEQRAERHFSSASILKVYDSFELETVDGVCVILQGFINKTRTLDNGFSSEVLDHFAIGFPPYWEEFAKSCVSKVNEGKKGFAEGHQKVNDYTNSKSGHLDSETTKMEVQDCEDTIIGTLQTTANCHEASLRVPQCYQHDAQHMKHDVVGNSPSSINITKDAVGTYSASTLEVSSRHPTGSVKKMDSIKKDAAQGSLLLDTSSLEKVILSAGKNGVLMGMSSKSTENSEHSVEVAREDSTSFDGKSDTVDLPRNSSDDTMVRTTVCSCLEERESCELHNLKSYLKGNSSCSDGVKKKTRNSISTSEENLKNISTKKQYPENISVNLSVGCGNGRIVSNEAACSCEGRVLRSKLKGKKNDLYLVNDSENQRNKSSSSPVCSVDQIQIKVADVSSDSVLGTMRNKSGAKKLNLFDAECSETLGPSSTKTLDTGCLVAAASENLTFVSSVKDSNEDDFLMKTSIDTCENKKTKQPAKSISKLHVPKAEYNLNAAAGKEEFAIKEVIMTRSNSKWKSTHGSSRCKVAKRKQIKSHRTAKSATRLGVPHTLTASEKVEKASIYPSRSSNETKQKSIYVSDIKNGSANILSPESFSGKRSRSGRLLLRSLEFWRNQTVVYDADRKIAGVKEDSSQPSKDVSEDKKLQKRKR